jgi:hypothetical protein
MLSGAAPAVRVSTADPMTPGAAVAGELVEHVLAELPALAVLEQRERLLAAAWLASLRRGPAAPTPGTCSGGGHGWPPAG